MVCSELLNTDLTGRSVLWYFRSILTTDPAGRPVCDKFGAFKPMILQVDLFCGMFGAF